MKKFVLIIAVFLFSFAIYAQDNTIHDNSVQKARKMTKKQRHKLIKDLNLTKEQKAAWKSSKKDYKEKQLAINNNSSLSLQQKKESIKELRRERLEKMRSLLTAEQIKKFQAETKSK